MRVRIDVTEVNPVIRFDMNLPRVSAAFNAIELPQGVRIYDGSYQITPLPYADQELHTSSSYVKRNIIVEKIPYFETSNEHGLTVYIGE